MEHERLTRIQNTVSLFILAVIIVMAACVLWTSRGKASVRLAYDYSYDLSDGWYYIDADGNETEIPEFPAVIPDSGDSQVIFRDIDVPLEQDLYLDFYTHHQDITVMIDEMEIYTYRADPSPKWLASYRSIHHFVRLARGTRGTLSYRINALLPDYRGEFQKVTAGDRLSLAWKIIQERSGKLLLGLVLILVGIFLFIMVFIFSSREEIDSALVYMSLMCVAIGLWQIEESRITQLFLGNAALHWCFEYLNQLAVLVTIFNFIRSITPEKYSLYTGVLFCIVTLSIAVQLLLQVLGIVQLSASITVTHILFIVCIIYGAILVNQRIHLSSKRIRMVFNISVGFSVLVFLIMLIASDAPEYTDSIMSLGLVFMFISMVFLVFQRTAERNASIKKNDLYQKLAMMDFTTGVGSHSAWYSFAEEFTDSGDGDSYCLVLFDMNNLKLMNDTYGHLQGDAVIKVFCECLQTATEKKGNIYRIGGDEFIFICRNETEDWIENMLHNFEELIKNQKETQIPFSAAYGYSFFVPHDKNDFYVAQNRADSQMYRMKREMKMKNPFVLP